MIFKVYYENNGEGYCDEVIVLDFVYGMNLVLVLFVGFKLVIVKLNECGEVDIDDLKCVVNENIVVIMLINLNILGIFEKNIMEICEIVYNVGGLLYYDGVNLNVIMDKVCLGDMGFDVVYLNLYKIFIGLYGGGGFGLGLVGVVKELVSYLLKLMVIKDGDKFKYDNDIKNFIGCVKLFYGNFGIYLRVYMYIRIMGVIGFKEVFEVVVFNVNYIKVCLFEYFEIFYK